MTPNGSSSAVGGDFKTHVKRRSGGKHLTDPPEDEKYVVDDDRDYGPLGPLDPTRR